MDMYEQHLRERTAAVTSIRGHSPYQPTIHATATAAPPKAYFSWPKIVVLLVVSLVVGGRYILSDVNRRQYLPGPIRRYIERNYIYYGRIAEYIPDPDSPPELTFWQELSLVLGDLAALVWAGLSNKFQIHISGPVRDYINNPERRLRLALRWDAFWYHPDWFWWRDNVWRHFSPRNFCLVIAALWLSAAMIDLAMSEIKGLFTQSTEPRAVKLRYPDWVLKPSKSVGSNSHYYPEIRPVVEPGAREQAIGRDEAVTWIEEVMSKTSEKPLKPSLPRTSTVMEPKPATEAPEPAGLGGKQYIDDPDAMFFCAKCLQYHCCEIH